MLPLCFFGAGSLFCGIILNVRPSCCNHLAEEEKADCFNSVLVFMWLSVSLSSSAMELSVFCDCGIS